MGLCCDKKRPTSNAPGIVTLLGMIMHFLLVVCRWSFLLILSSKDEVSYLPTVFMCFTIHSVVQVNCLNVFFGPSQCALYEGCPYSCEFFPLCNGVVLLTTSCSLLWWHLSVTLNLPSTYQVKLPSCLV